MTILNKLTFEEVQQIFRSENGKSARDPFPEDRLSEAQAQSGEWYECVLSIADALEVKLPWNKEFDIPKSGLTVAEALSLPKVLGWQAPNYLDSHVFLSVFPIVGAVEYREIRESEGRLIHFDGLHRLLAWAKLGKSEIRAIVAGNACDRGK